MTLGKLKVVLKQMAKNGELDFPVDNETANAILSSTARD